MNIVHCQTIHQSITALITGWNLSQMCTNSLLRRQVIDEGTSDAKSACLFRSATCASASRLNRREVIGVSAVFQIKYTS
jgi:hypothetical protein